MSRGRPAIDVHMEEVEYLRSLRFSWTKIAEIVGISRRTLYRRLGEWDLPIEINYAILSDSELDRLVADIKRMNPNYGEILLMAQLNSSYGVRVQRSRLRASIHRIDPYATQLRRRETVRRRVYSVEAPNSIWHLDGHHKIIRWKLVTHGGIDGKTRTIVFLSCASNNCASTVLLQFNHAVSSFGIPDRVRTDKGGENVDVWRYMFHMHGQVSAIIAGSSVHNERIERLWRDVYRCVISNYYELFYELEGRGELDPLNEADIYCLHFVFLPRINKHLYDFSESWNHHAISTEHNHTPYQLIILGYRSTSSLAAQQGPFIPQSVTLPLSLNTTQHVQIPRSNFVPCSALLSALNRNVNPLEERTDFGHGLYLAAINIVGHHLQLHNSCTSCFVIEN